MAEVDTAMKGGLLGAVTRTVLGGETLFANTFTSRGGPGEITLAPSLEISYPEIDLGIALLDRLLDRAMKR